LSPRGVMGRAEQGKNIPRGGEGAHKLMRCSNKVKKILLKKPMKSSVLNGSCGRRRRPRLCIIRPTTLAK
ncbi:MAG: hypothetical protein ACKO6R_08305, partial [Burkholderiaceae bacterium]